MQLIQKFTLLVLAILYLICFDAWAKRQVRGIESLRREMEDHSGFVIRAEPPQEASRFVIHVLGSRVDRLARTYCKTLRKRIMKQAI